MMRLCTIISSLTSIDDYLGEEKLSMSFSVILFIFSFHSFVLITKSRTETNSLIVFLVNTHVEMSKKGYVATRNDYTGQPLS